MKSLTNLGKTAFCVTLVFLLVFSGYVAYQVVTTTTCDEPQGIYQRINSLEAEDFVKEDFDKATSKEIIIEFYKLKYYLGNLMSMARADVIEVGEGFWKDTEIVATTLEKLKQKQLDSTGTLQVLRELNSSLLKQPRFEGNFKGSDAINL